MNKFIAYCGLNCETCETRLATVNNDNELRKKVAAEWSKLNQVEILPEMINCEGCRMDGVKTPFCDSLCEIRKCAIKNNMETCRSCGQMKSCEKLKMISDNNEIFHIKKSVRVWKPFSSVVAVVERVETTRTEE